MVLTESILREVVPERQSHLNLFLRLKANTLVTLYQSGDPRLIAAAERGCNIVRAGIYSIFLKEVIERVRDHCLKVIVDPAVFVQAELQYGVDRIRFEKDECDFDTEFRIPTQSR